jgi:hypothetical protein
MFIGLIVVISDEIAYYEILFYKASPEKYPCCAGKGVFKAAPRLS